MPKVSKTSNKKDELTNIVNEIENLKVSKKKDNSIIFPPELDEISDPGDTDDTDDIIAKYKHDSYEEYKKLIFLQNISIKCANYVKNLTVLKLSDKEKSNLNKLINKIYSTLVIYNNEISLNYLNPIYEHYDDKSKDFLKKINALTNKLIESSFLLKKRLSYKKAELVVFFNNSTQLFTQIYEIIEYLYKLYPEHDSQTS